MPSSPQTYTDLEAKIAACGAGQPDIRAILVIGSRARRHHPADEWSDLDLIVFTNNVARYATDAGWLAELGVVWASALTRTGRGDPEWSVIYAGGLKADFVLMAATPGATLQEWVDAFPYHFVLARGVRVLFSQSASPLPLITPVIANAPLPSQFEFTDKIHQALIDVMRQAKFLLRGDLWRAKQVSDVVLRQYLLTFLEWHARAIPPSLDVWYGGRFLEEWADPRAVAALPGVFGAYDRDDLWRSLDAYLDLIHWLAAETAARLDYPFPKEPVQRIRAWITASREKGSR
jgi:aminoglycoside 6-adenylyltransferase